jgi:ESCRT-II complex subunit VPS25
MAARFSWPPVYNFPPFWTLQDVMETRRRQCDLWGDLIMKYMAQTNQSEIVLDTALGWPLFNNTTINRRLDRPTCLVFLNQLVSRKNAQWIKPDEKLKILFKKPEEWASVLLLWARNNQFINTVMTFTDLREGADTRDQPFHMLDLEVMKQAVLQLEKQKQAKFMPRENLEDCGVKFLS